MCVQPCSTTLFGVPFPLPTAQGAGIGNSGTIPRPRFEGCAEQPSGQEAHSANLFRKECQGCSEARKPSCPAPQIYLPRRLSPPRYGSADRRLRTEVNMMPAYDSTYQCYHFCVTQQATKTSVQMLIVGKLLLIVDKLDKIIDERQPWFVGSWPSRREGVRPRQKYGLPVPEMSANSMESCRHESCSVSPKR